MEEKKQTGKWLYSPWGKGVRGFLCLVTFITFCVSTMITMFVASWYGTEIYTNPKESYYETNMYQLDLEYEINAVLGKINQLELIDIDNNRIAILHMEDSTIRYYDAKAIGELLSFGYDLSDGVEIADIKDFQVGEPILIKDKDLSDFNGLKSFLELKGCDIDYIYYNEEAFKDLFVKGGLVNKDHRFSEEFSEGAYFVFENYEVKKAQSEDAKKEEVKIDEDTTDVKENEADVIITPYNLTSYAAYDPQKDLYYSTGDDFFEEMDSYIYGVDDLLSRLNEMPEGDSYYNSIVIPILRSYNLSVTEIMNYCYELYDMAQNEENHLSLLEKEGIYYYVQLADGELYTNISSNQPEQAMMNLKHYYRFEKDEDGNLTQSHSGNVPDMENVGTLSEGFQTYSMNGDAAPGVAVYYFGFEKDSFVLDPTENILIQSEKVYDWIASYCVEVVVLAVVSFLLLMVQAISLIYTTGRRYKHDTQVKLNHFDRWYTEIWIFVTFVIMAFSVLCGVGAVSEIGNYESFGIVCIYTAIGALPFGFFFMVLTLSFVRRLKAHNIWNQFLFVKCIKHIHNKETVAEEDKKETTSAFVKAVRNFWNRCKEKYYSIKGTRKLLIAFVVFLVVETAVVFMGMSNELYAGPAFIYFLLLQILALLALTWVIRDIEKLAKGVEKITKGDLDSKVEINERLSILGDLADGVNHIGDGLKQAVETSIKDERMKTELITNVSHDLKTPLTSIINYVDLLKKQEMPNEDAKHYVDVLDAKAQRLKQLTEDLVEAAKATSGNIELEMMPLTFDELMKQALGEFEDKFEKRKLAIIANYPEEPAVVMADGRRLYRIIENVLQNIYKYAMEGTRVYADLEKDAGVVTFTLKNVSKAPLNISTDELMERFTRGDSSRTTEGSGLGLSIAKDLTRLQNGEFEIQLDGDLFKVMIRFPEYKQTDHLK
ncbi:MAG: HAMP domain-containing histidine kinase [Lachnospiraceae bacterium]|nr:HAMP domain-containing histidine kinase [Lachnospiraceae bacterium]